MNVICSLSLLWTVLSPTGAFSPAALPSHRRAAFGVGGSRCPTSTCMPSRRPADAAGCSSIARRPLPPSHHVGGFGSRETRLRAASAPAAPTPRKFTRKKSIATLMAFLTGWADYIFIKKHGFFATMMTGNSMKLADALVYGRFVDAAFFVSVIATYVAGVGTFRRAELSYKDRALNGLFAPVVAGCFLWSDYLTWTNPSSRFLPAMLLSFSWGIVNSVGSEVTGTLIFVVTGAMTRFSNFIVDRISRTAGRKKIPKEGFLMSLSVIGGFILGAAWSAFLGMKAPKLMSRGAFSILGGIYGLLFLWLDREEFGAWWSRKNGKLCEMDAEEIDCK